MVIFVGAYKRLLAVGKRVGDRKYTASELTKLIRRQFPATDFVFKTHRDYAVDPDSVIVAGHYDCNDDSENVPSITITLCYHPEQDVYFVKLLNWERLAFDIAECMGHELVHRDQYQNGRKPALRPYKSKSIDPAILHEQNYLGGDDEIEAYGFSIAAEQYVFQRTVEHCAMYEVYKTIFDTDPKVVLQLEQQVSKYLKYLEQL